MRTNIWGLLTAAIGLAITVLLVAFGTEYGTWLDEIGPYINMDGQPPAAPTIVLPAVIGLLAVGLVIGGLATGLASPRRERARAAAVSPSSD